jgi:hypothetical protein
VGNLDNNKKDSLFHEKVVSRLRDDDWKCLEKWPHMEWIRIRIRQNNSVVTPIVFFFFVGIPMEHQWGNVNLSQFIKVLQISSNKDQKPTQTLHTRGARGLSEKCFSHVSHEAADQTTVRILHDFWSYCCHLAQFIDDNLINKDSSYRDFLKI